MSPRSVARALERRIAPRRSLARGVRKRSRYCRRLGSDLYAALLERVADDIEAGGPCWQIMCERAGAPAGSRLSLRLLAALHRLALSGQAPALAAHYPTCGGDGDVCEAFAALLEAAEERRAELRLRLEVPVQRNEVGRSAALFGGFLTVAGETGCPLYLLELGASAGLNLRWDLYHYERQGVAWGNPSSPVHLSWESGLPPVDVPVRVAARRGCDLNPLDPACPQDRLTLSSYVWANQVERLHLLGRALAVAAGVPVAVDAADAVVWLERRLQETRAGVTTVVFHTLFEQQLPADARAAILAMIVAAGKRATEHAPLAWLRLEAGGKGTSANVKLALWPGGVDQTVATATLHGSAVRWLGQQSALNGGELPDV